jgi:hypothetical protein
MAGTASHCPVSRQATIEGQPLAQGDLLGGLRIVRRYRRASRAVGDANFVEGTWAGPTDPLREWGVLSGWFAASLRPARLLLQNLTVCPHARNQESA